MTEFTKARVYIVTTSGLVEIQSVVELPDSTILSFVCVNKSVSLSDISNAYERFVSSEHGVIHKYFGITNCRMSISDNIDMGDSWQLATFIAHALHSQGRLIKSEDRLHLDDKIILATGIIDPISSAVEPVQLLQQKLLNAQKDIHKLGLSKYNIQFLVPLTNLKEGSQTFDFPLLGVKTLQQVMRHLKEVNLILDVEQKYSLASSKVDMSSAYHSNQSSFEATNNSDKVYINLVLDITQNILQKNRLVCMSILISMIALVGLWWLNLSQSSIIYSQRFGISADISIQRKDCELAERHVLFEQNLAYRGTLPVVSKEHTCSLQVHSSFDVKQVWLVNRASEIIQLSPDYQNFAENSSSVLALPIWWYVPDSFVQEEQYGMHILLFEQEVDRSDLDSLVDYIDKSLNQQNKDFESVVKRWSSVLDISVNIYFQPLN